MKKIAFLLIFNLIHQFCFAQLPDCAGVDSNCVFLHGSNDIYRYDPSLPLSATNPSVFLTSGTMPWGGLTISYNLNGGAASPTFYATDGGVYHYWDGANWVNTGHTASTVNLGGGMATIYGKNGGTGFISKYTGAGNDAFFVNGHANSGPYDLVTDASDNLYEVDISNTIGYIYKYNTAGVIVDTFVVLNVTPQTAGPGFAMVGNQCYFGLNTSPNLYGGTLLNDTVVGAPIGTLTQSYGDFANCPTVISSTPTASLVYPTCLGPVNISISSTLLFGNPTFAWNFGDPGSGINNNSTNANPTHTFSGAGTYTVTLVITNGGATDTILNTINIVSTLYDSSYVSICEPNSYMGYNTSGVYIDSFISQHGCDSLHTLFLTVNPLKYTTIDTTICFGQTFLGYSASGTYTDIFPSAAGCDSTRTLNLTIRPKIETFIKADICSNSDYEGYTQTGNYTDIFQSYTGCDSTRNLDLTVHQSPDVSLSFSTDEICKGDFVNITASGADTYIWYLNGSSTPVSTSDNYNVQVNEHEYVLVEGFSTFGCRDVEYNTFHYVPCCGHVFVPNAFSPNGDGKNDLFRVKVDRDMESYMLQIFNRWGTEIYRSDDIKEGWNGMYKGKECDVDTYQYLIHTKCKDSKILKGDIMLVR